MATADLEDFLLLHLDFFFPFLALYTPTPLQRLRGKTFLLNFPWVRSTWTPMYLPLVGFFLQFNYFQAVGKHFLLSLLRVTSTWRPMYLYHWWEYLRVIG